MGEGLAHYEGHHTGQEGLDCVRKRASKQPSFMVSTCVPPWLLRMMYHAFLPLRCIWSENTIRATGNKWKHTVISSLVLTTPETSLKCTQINDLKENQSRALQGKVLLGPIQFIKSNIGGALWSFLVVYDCYLGLTNALGEAFQASVIKASFHWLIQQILTKVTAMRQAMEKAYRVLWVDLIRGLGSHWLLSLQAYGRVTLHLAHPW